MGAVYGNAFVTVTAAGAEDCQKGIFFPRCPNRGMPFRFLAQKLDKEGGETAGYLYFDRSFSRFSMSDDEPVDKRAWTLQERLLSPRVIKYGRDAVSWECRSGVISEFDATVRTGSLKAYQLPRHTSVEQWMRTVKDYSSRALTFSTDRIPALLGVAQKFQECLLRMQYVAGLWQSPQEETILLRLLLWHTVIDTPEQWETTERLPGPT
ncbi:hypothetical protein B0T25DRAFT_598337 [Lasiosphaeria hispida]|uniref:Heterokaryon incompatibility domain-containing protein n=1 Tax=Lasiosphaeria hispida TaxID=260671 RepID=A0AAJ0HXE8_9PEZI|nr:hypothetical protein B0T25DRAFT_598337 [Lasiosphaeria hispida]